MYYAYSLLLLLTLAPYSIHGMNLRPQCEPMQKRHDLGNPQEGYGGQGFVKKDTFHLKDALKRYLKGKEATVSKDIIKQLKGQDNIALFNECMYDLNKNDDTNFAPLISLMPILFDFEVLKSGNYHTVLASFTKNPEILNKALFGLKIPLPESRDIGFYSEMIEKLWYVDPSEKGNLKIYDSNIWLFVNQQFFYHTFSSEPYLKSMRPMTEEEKKCYWQDSFRPKFHADCCDQEAVSRYRAQVKYILLMSKRLHKTKGSGLGKYILPQIILPLFEQEFTDFKNHCNNAEIELGKEIGLTNIEDPEQKPFFDKWYEQEKKECFRALETFETVQKILSYKFGR